MVSQVDPNQVEKTSFLTFFHSHNAILELRHHLGHKQYKIKLFSNHFSLAQENSMSSSFLFYSAAEYGRTSQTSQKSQQRKQRMLQKPSYTGTQLTRSQLRCHKEPLWDQRALNLNISHQFTQSALIHTQPKSTPSEMTA